MVAEARACQNLFPHWLQFLFAVYDRVGYSSDNKNIIPNVTSFSWTNVFIYQILINIVIDIIVCESAKDASEDSNPEDTPVVGEIFM